MIHLMYTIMECDMTQTSPAFFIGIEMEIGEEDRIMGAREG